MNSKQSWQTRKQAKPALLFFLAVTGTSLFAQAVLLSDFEETKYVWLPGGVWTATETCFGSGARWGRLPNQQTVEGWLGNGLVNTYLHRRPQHHQRSPRPPELQRSPRPPELQRSPPTEFR